MKQQPLRLIVLFVVLIAGSLLNSLASATVINVPPDPDFAALGRLSPGTTVNLMEGGTTAAGISADGSTINVLGGVLGGSISVSQDSRVTVTSGQIQGRVFMEDSGQFLMTGGTVEGNVNMHSRITARIEGGFVGGRVESDFDSEVTIAGGSVGSAEASDGALMVIAGGVVRGGVYDDDGGVVHITGGEILGDVSLGDGAGSPWISGGTFRGDLTLSGYPAVWAGGVVEGAVKVKSNTFLNVVGSGFTLDGLPLSSIPPGGSMVVERRDATLAGVLSDGKPFAIDLSGSGVDQIGDNAVMTVVQVPEPAAMTLLMSLLSTLGSRGRRPAG